MPSPMRLFRPDFRTIFKNLSNYSESQVRVLDTIYDTITDKVDKDSLNEDDTAALVWKHTSRVEDQSHKCFEAIMGAIWPRSPKCCYIVFDSTALKLDPHTSDAANDIKTFEIFQVIDAKSSITIDDDRLVIKKEGAGVQLLGQLCGSLPIPHSGRSNNATTPEGGPSTSSPSSLNPSSDHSHGTKTPSSSCVTAFDDSDSEPEPFTSNSAASEKYVFSQKIINFYPMPSGRELRRHPTMIELSAPGADTIVLGVREPPILPLVRTFSREHPGGLPPFHNMRGTSFDPAAASGIIEDDDDDDDDEEEEIISGSNIQPAVSAQSRDSGRNLKKRPRDDLDDEEETTRPRVKSCLKVPPKPSLAPTLTPSGNGEDSINNGTSKKRTRDSDEEDIVRPSTRVRLTPRQEYPAGSARDVSLTPPDRRSVRFASPRARLTPRQESPAGGVRDISPTPPYHRSVRFASPEADTRSSGSMTHPPDNLLASSPGEVKEEIEGQRSEAVPSIPLLIVLPPRKKQKVRKAYEG